VRGRVEPKDDSPCHLIHLLNFVLLLISYYPCALLPLNDLALDHGPDPNSYLYIACVKTVAAAVIGV
jgi:hypothetical protein